MCTSRVTVAYGLTVRAGPLIIAADAWTRLEIPLRFFDLVFLRRRMDTLVSSNRLGKEAVTKIPVEIWEEIRYWVVQEEMNSSERIFLEPLVCSTCRAGPYAQGIFWSNLRRDGADCLGEEGFSEWCDYNLGYWAPDQASELGSFLSAFGLGLAYCQPVQTREESDWLGIDSLALLSIPSRFVRGSSENAVVNAECGGDSGPDGHTIVDISYELPSDAQQRFTRLICLFNLEVVESSIDEISSLPEQAVKAKDKGKKTTAAKLSGVKDRVTKEIRPRWLLWMTNERNW